MSDTNAAPITRLSLLTNQYDASYESLAGRLVGLTDHEYFWEPVANCWSVRPAGQNHSQNPHGKGQWRFDFTSREQNPPFTTIAWRMCHIVEMLLGRYDYTFGAKSLTWDDIDFPGTANDAIALLYNAHQKWRAGLASLSDSDLDIVGLSSFPFGLDSKLPFGEILWWVNRELIHHAAEVALLRDLYKFTVTAS